MGDGPPPLLKTCAMDPELARWAARLAPARLSGGHVPDPPCPITLAVGYAIAEETAPELGTAAGYKIGATSSAAMAALGIAEPIRGRLFAERIWSDGAAIAVPGVRPPEAEPEVAIRLALPLAPGADPRPAIGAVRLAAEIVRATHADPFALGPGFIVADNAAGLGALLGPPLPPAALDQPAAIVATLSVDGGPATRGSADAVLGSPLAALGWLAATLGGLAAGQWVLTGAMARAIPVPPGATLRLDGGALGATSASF